MKTQYIILAFIFIISSMFVVKGQHNALQKETIKVWGECGMCKKKIETAAKDAGASTANWNQNTKMLVVAYNSKTDKAKIEGAIAAAGYDTKDIAATNDAYSKLPACCHYDRKEANPKDAGANCCEGEKACKKDMQCCKDANCGKNSSDCKDMSACKDKGCGKS